MTQTTRTKHNPAFWPNTARLVSPLSPPDKALLCSGSVPDSVFWMTISALSGVIWGEWGQHYWSASKQTNGIPLLLTADQWDTISPIWSSSLLCRTGQSPDLQTRPSRPRLKLQLSLSPSLAQPQPVLLVAGWARLDPPRQPSVFARARSGQDHTTCCYWGAGSRGRVESTTSGSGSRHSHQPRLLASNTSTTSTSTSTSTPHLSISSSTRLPDLLQRCPPPLASHCLSCLCLALSTSPACQTSASSWAASSHQREWSQLELTISFNWSAQLFKTELANYLPSSF